MSDIDPWMRAQQIPMPGFYKKKKKRYNLHHGKIVTPIKFTKRLIKVSRLPEAYAKLCDEHWACNLDTEWEAEHIKALRRLFILTYAEYCFKSV